MKIFLILTILFVCMAIVNCKIVAEQKDSQNLNNEAVSQFEGYFDLKSVCLNLASRPKSNEAVCEAPLSKSLKPNSETIWVTLEICNNQRKANCIEPFPDPDNFPPETIQIRDKESNLITSWGKVKAKMASNSIPNQKESKPLVIEIKEI